MLEVPETKVFGGKRYFRSRWERRKKQAQENAKALREQGFKVRITEIHGGYQLWTC